MSRVARYVVMAGLMDVNVYLVASLTALLAEKWGAGPFALGLLPVVWAAPYSVAAVLAGRISDRVSRTRLARAGLLLVSLTCVGFLFATRLWHFYLGLPVIALGMSLFWPGLQAAIADESTARTLTRNVGLFNVAWGFGKGTGVLLGGILSETIGSDGFLGAAVLGVILVFVMPHVPRGGGLGGDLGGEDVVPAQTRTAFRWAALAANFAAFGMGTTIVHHYPEWNAELGRGGYEYGIVVGAVFLAQTLAFAVLLAPGWQYRRGPLLLPQVLALAGGVMLATELPVVLLLPASLCLGAGFGVAYFSSLYYSLHADVGRGGRAGFHEAILASGNFMVPFVAGAVARAAGGPRLPYLFAAGVMAVALVMQLHILRHDGRMGRG